MSIGAFFTLEQDGQKSGGAMPPSLKSGGATGPPGPPQFRRLWSNIDPFLFCSYSMSHFLNNHNQFSTNQMIP